MTLDQIYLIITLWNRFNLYLSRIIGFGVQEMPLKYFLSRTYPGSGRLCGYDFITFQVKFYKKLLIIMSLDQIYLIITLWNILNLYLSRIIGFGLQELPLKYFLSRTCPGSGRPCGYGFMTFQVNAYKKILIIMSVKQIRLIITLQNRLYLYFSRIIGFGVQEMPLKYFLSRTCAGSGRLFGDNFMTVSGQFP